MAQKNKNRPSLIPQSAAGKSPKTNFLNKDVAKLEGWSRDEHPLALVCLRFVQHNKQCFSEWNRDQMKAFWSFQERVSQLTWQQIVQTGGKDPSQKTGLNCTMVDPKQYPTSDFLNSLSPDVTMIKLRVSGEIRVHGFRSKSVFYLCWLDKDHDLLGK